MENRQAQLLHLVIESHIATAEPIGSRFLVERAGLEWSEATVRNDLRALEEEGYLTHPHTSAGRVPTSKGYRYYIDHADLAAATPSKQERTALEQAVEDIRDYEQARKNIAKTLVELSHEMVLIAFSVEQVYYTGLANLFQKPDFGEQQVHVVVDISQVFDQCEQYLPDFFDDVETEPRYFLGDEHPFGEMLSVLSARFGKRHESLIALLGPQRMDYRKNWGLMMKAKELI